MPPRKRDVDEVRALCAQVHADDGVDPREDSKQDARTNSRADRKLQQLCKQVANALHLVVAHCPGDPRIACVVPAPNAGRLRVRLVVTNGADQDGASEWLARRAGALRAEVAQAVSRRRVPELVFEVVLEERNDA